MNALLKNPDEAIDNIINQILVLVVKKVVPKAIKESRKYVKNVSNQSKKAA
jgi:hypothetical protein